MNTIQKTQTITEYHNNGALWLETTIGFIEPMFIDAHSNNTQLRTLIDSEPSSPYIVLSRKKHFDNGLIKLAVIAVHCILQI